MAINSDFAIITLCSLFMLVNFYWEPCWRQPAIDRSNPYASLLGCALEKKGIALNAGEYVLDCSWLVDNRDNVSVLHLNWLHYFYRHDDIQRATCLVQQMIDWLQVAKALDYRIVWTAHNIYPHERKFPHLDHDVRIAVAKIADHLIVHCSNAADAISKNFGRRHNVHIIPHGNFIGVYPNNVNREKARERLCIPRDAFVYLFFGNARRYKGIQKLIEAYKRISNENTYLMLMLRSAFDPFYVDELKELANCERIGVHSSDWFPESELQYYLNAADSVVLPFEDVLTSGSAITALSFGVPIVAPALGCLPELIGNDVGIIYDPGASDALDRALEKIRFVKQIDVRKAALEKAQALDWNVIANRIAEVYCGS